MNTIEISQPTGTKAAKGDVIQLPLGLLGFEQIKNYSLFSKPDEAPFMWFQMNDGAGPAFLVVSPLQVMADYQPDISAEDVEFLELSTPEDALLFNIVTLKSDGKATINLKGPIVVNRHSLMGKQVIPNNVAQYALNHPLPVS